MCPYLCKTLVGSNRVDLDVLALLDEPQVGVVGLVVIHVERLQNKQHQSALWKTGREKKKSSAAVNKRRESPSIVKF